jgi:hypothetical protein
LGGLRRSAATKKIGEDAKKAAMSGVGGVVTGRKKQAHLHGIWSRGSGMVVWGTEAMLQIELVIAVVMP